MSESHSIREVKPSDLLNQLESILESDPSIDEVGFIHPTQFAALSESSGTPSRSSLRTVLQSADRTIEAKVSEVNPSDIVFWSIDHKLGISTQVLLPLYNATKHAFMASREQYKMMGNMYVKEDGDRAENVSSTLSSLNILESEVMKHSRALLLLSCDFGTAWNSRKEVVSKKQLLPVYIDELLFSSLVLSYSPKSEHTWSHRRWVIKMIAGKCSNLQEIVEKESELVKRMAEKSKMNYRAWNHRCWLVSYMPRNQVLDELIKYRDWDGLHVADNSCFHYRKRLLLKMLEDSSHKQVPNKCPGYIADLYQVWKEELDWNEMLIKRYIGREALWLYRRFLSLYWINHFASNIPSHSDSRNMKETDFYMDKELQLFRSCANIPDNVFEDYQSQATFSATYILWLVKHIYKSHSLEFQKKLGEVEALLNTVCPEKAFLWDFLRTKSREAIQSVEDS